MKIWISRNIYARLKTKWEKISVTLPCKAFTKWIVSCIYFASVHLYLNLANIALASTYRIKLKAVLLLQKRVLRIIFHENNMTHLSPLLRSLNALNVFQINLFQHLRFMHNFNKNKTIITFTNLIKKHLHKYPTKFSKSSVSPKIFFLNVAKYCIFIQRTQSLEWFFNKWGKRSKLLPSLFKSY